MRVDDLRPQKLHELAAEFRRRRHDATIRDCVRPRDGSGCAGILAGGRRACVGVSAVLAVSHVQGNHPELSITLVRRGRLPKGRRRRLRASAVGCHESRPANGVSSRRSPRSAVFRQRSCETAPDDRVGAATRQEVFVTAPASTRTQTRGKSCRRHRSRPGRCGRGVDRH